MNPILSAHYCAQYLLEVEKGVIVDVYV